MRHIVKAAYKDALHHLRSDMARRVVGHSMHPDEEDMEKDSMANTPEGMSAQDKSDDAESELGLNDQERPEEDSMTDEEKQESLFPKRKAPPKHGRGIAIVIASGKKVAGKKK